MGKVLLIEPQRILQQAISLSLFPEYEVKIEDDIGSALRAVKDYDLLIVDGAALQERSQLTPDVIRSVQGCKTPTLWLEEETASQTPKRDKLVVIKKPVEKEKFESALAGLLSPVPSREPGVSATARPVKGSAPRGVPKKQAAETSGQPSFQFIDLVDVVEEQLPPKQGKKTSRKSK
ncbi:MAG: hypothetical protein HYY45_21055 [Deltaproteobacteria bacterium]|nr:hypothetical protein [Deltaproteobacteria bacterium]